MHPLKQGDAKPGSSSFVPVGNFTVYKHSSFMVQRPNKKLFEDFAQSISRAVSIVLSHNDSPVIAWERALTGDLEAHHIGMTKPSICSWVSRPPPPHPFTHPEVAFLLNAPLSSWSFSMRSLLLSELPHKGWTESAAYTHFSACLLKRHTSCWQRLELGLVAAEGFSSGRGLHDNGGLTATSSSVPFNKHASSLCVGQLDNK